MTLTVRQFASACPTNYGFLIAGDDAHRPRPAARHARRRRDPQRAEGGPVGGLDFILNTQLAPRPRRRRRNAEIKAATGLPRYRRPGLKGDAPFAPLDRTVRRAGGDTVEFGETIFQVIRRPAATRLGHIAYSTRWTASPSLATPPVRARLRAAVEGKRDQMWGLAVFWPPLAALPGRGPKVLLRPRITPPSNARFRAQRRPRRAGAAGPRADLRCSPPAKRRRSGTCAQPPSAWKKATNPFPCGAAPAGGPGSAKGRVAPRLRSGSRRSGRPRTHFGGSWQN